MLAAKAEGILQGLIEKRHVAEAGNLVPSRLGKQQRRGDPSEAVVAALATLGALEAL